VPGDQPYVAEQYGDAARFNARVEAHALYSEQPGEFRDWLIPNVAPRPGLSLLDAGCGPGNYHAALAGAALRITACDLSDGMLRDVAAQARRIGGDVAPVRADAEALPFRDAAFDRVMANHMLYHVADQPRALAEMRRVLRPGGRIVLATNAADNCARFFELHARVAPAAGYALPAGAGANVRFTLDHLPLVLAAFPSARVLRREDAFLFPDAEPALRYYSTFMVDMIDARPAGGTHRATLIEGMRREIDAIIGREGGFRVPKAAGCFVADV